ncbi:MAG: ATP-binding protein [Clostridium perfringens]
MYNNLYDIVIRLIDSGIEGDYWDFKQRWHKDNEELLRDILSFANTIHSKDCFLIIGVSDNCEIIGVEDDENRKQQANILDLLGNCNFAGQNIPQISIETLNLNNKEVDVLIIYNSNDVPIYITKRNKKQHKIQENYIYSRVGDRNTPMNENSNIYIIEQLWRKRFGLNRDSIELFKEALKDKMNWNENKLGWYYKFNPEFVIKVLDDDSKNYDAPFYAYVMMNPRSSYSKLQLVYKGTMLQEFTRVVLDSGRYSTISPDFAFISQKNYKTKLYEYRFFIKGSIEYLLYEFLFRDELAGEEREAKRRFDSVILIFNDKEESKQFNKYVNSRIEKLELHVNKDLKNQLNYTPRDKLFNQYICEHISTGKYCKKMLEKFREEIKNN